jgi:DNA polymerase delta subunit 1
MLDYCARDADIPLLLIMKLNYLPIWIEMSRVTYTPVHQVLNGGQQRKVYNLLAHFVHNTHAINKCESEWPISTYASDDDSYDEIDSMEDALVKRKPDYQGATVIEPKTGFYTTSVSTLDFESLYPSIMIHFNLCPSVYVVPSTAASVSAASVSASAAAASVPAAAAAVCVENHIIKHSILESADTYKDFERTYGFVKNVQGVVPKLLQHLLAARKVAKKAMANATNDFDRSVQNGRQLALKVSCNSVYGFFGVTPGRGLMSCKPVAAVTTLKGRAFIEAAKNYVEQNYSGSEVIYGDTDSIMINWGQLPDVPKAYRLAEEASAAITELLRNGTVEGCTKPMLASAVSAVTLANEKVYRPYLLIQKKNYAGFKYLLKGRHQPETLDDFETSVDMKGIDAVRRDRSKLIKTLSGSLLDALLIEGSLTKAIEQLKETLATVASQKAPLDWFVLSKSLKSRYKTDNQPHVQARKRMIMRGDQDVPEIGTRMPYVIVRPKGAKTTGPLYLRTEHPEFVAKDKIPYCAKYYLENAQDVIIRLLRPTGKEALVTKIFSDAIASADHLASGNMSLMSFFSKKQRTQ